MFVFLYEEPQFIEAFFGEGGRRVFVLFGAGLEDDSDAASLGRHSEGDAAEELFILAQDFGGVAKAVDDGDGRHGQAAWRMAGRQFQGNKAASSAIL